MRGGTEGRFGVADMSQAEVRLGGRLGGASGEKGRCMRGGMLVRAGRCPGLADAPPGPAARWAGCGRRSGIGRGKRSVALVYDKRIGNADGVETGF